MKALGKSDSDLVNNFIPYVICKVDPNAAEGGAGKKLSLGEMAFSPEEFMDKKRNLQIDTEWYITNQLLPPITRLIEHIDGIEVDFVAQCLGVDAKKYNYNQGARGADRDEDGLGTIANPIIKTETTEKLQDRSLANLKIVCPSCDEAFDFPEIFHKKGSKAEGVASNICPNQECGALIPAQYIKNRARLFLKQLQVMYYKGQYTCRDISCRHQTRELLYEGRCIVPGCNKRVYAEVAEHQANDTLRYLEGLFNVEKYLNELRMSKTDTRKGGQSHGLDGQVDGLARAEEQIPHAELLRDVKQYVDEVLQRSKYNKVDLG